MPSRRRFLVVMGGNKLLSLPYLVDFTTLGNGGLPAPWSSPTWSVLSGQVINAPTLGNDLLTDGGLEATYTAGLCGTLTKTGSPSLAQSATVPTGSPGTKAQQFQAVAQNNALAFASVTPTAKNWYDIRVWALRAATGGSPQVRAVQAVTGVAFTKVMTVTSYTLLGGMMYVNTNNVITLNPIRDVGTSGWDVITVDDCFIKPITSPEQLFSGFTRTTPNITVKIRFPQLTYGTIGAIVRANTNSSPTSYLLMRAEASSSGSTTFRAYLEQFVNGTRTELISSNITYVADKDFELRVSGNTASLWFNGTQSGTDQAVDASLAGNPYMALFGSAGGALTRFFAQAS